MKKSTMTTMWTMKVTTMSNMTKFLKTISEYNIISKHAVPFNHSTSTNKHWSLPEENIITPITDPHIVIQRIMKCSADILLRMDQGDDLIIRNQMNPMGNSIRFGKSGQGSRYFADILYLMEFILQLLCRDDTATLRGLFYALKPRIQNQEYSNRLLWRLANILGVSRRSLGIVASSKGLMGGCIVISRKKTLPSGEEVVNTMNGCTMLPSQDMHITCEWLERDENGWTSSSVKVNAATTAKVILVVEKEGTFQHLLNARFFEAYPCILVTGRGYPDVATRALVWSLHKELDLPVVGICDYNPYGIQVLGAYFSTSNIVGIDGGKRYSVPIRWLGLWPSHITPIEPFLPVHVFQSLTDSDMSVLDTLIDGKDYLMDEDCSAIIDMKTRGYKLELETLHRLSLDIISSLVLNMLEENIPTNGSA